MKKRETRQQKLKLKVKSHKLSIHIAKPEKKLSDLVGVYQDLEQTLKKLKTRSLLQVEHPLMQINIKELINQLSKSKRRIERKITSALLNERTQIVHQLDKWAPRLGEKISKRRRTSAVSDREKV